MKLWGGRFEAGPSQVFEEFSGSLHFDRRLVFADIEGSKAFARALHRAGILSSAESEGLISAFDAIAAEAKDPHYFDGANDEDVHTFVIRKLGEKAGGLADKIHTGRSRNEQVSVDVRLWLRASSTTLIEQTLALAEALLDLASKYPDAVIPGYTHVRRAQAVLWPHYLLAYFEMFSRDIERLAQARERINVLPLGSGALAGSGFPFDRESIAADLGFASITRNSMDASADRDFALDFLYACSLVMLHLSRLAEDWILYSSEEFAWLSLGDGVTSGSSLMPQKKNPDSLELIRGKSGRVFGDFTSLFVTMKGLPMTYNRDMQEDKEPIFDAFAQTSGSLAMAKVVAESVALDPSKPAAAAEESWVVATDLAEELARNGVAFHRAHQLVGKLVLESVKKRQTPIRLDSAGARGFCPRVHAGNGSSVRGPQEGMKTRSLPGGTAPAAGKRGTRRSQAAYRYGQDA